MLRLVAGAVTALVMADTVATTLAMPILSRDPVVRAVPLSELNLMTTANLATIAALLVSGGRLADLIGRRIVLAVGAAAFAVGALLVTFGPFWPVLLAGRLVQGAGSALMLPAALGLLLGQCDERRRPGAVALWGAATGVGGLVMHAAGGFFLDAYGWRLLYLPHGLTAIALLLLVKVLPMAQLHRHRAPDLVGTLSLITATAALVLVVTYGARWGWTSLITLITTITMISAGGLALARSRRHPAGAIDMELWRSPGVRWGAFISLLYGVMAFALLNLVPMALGEQGLSTGRIGLTLAPLSAAVTLASPLVAPLVRRVGLLPTVYVGAFLSGTGFLLLIVVPVTSGPGLATLILLGVGFGLVSTTATVTGTLDTGTEGYAAAVGTLTTARILGGAIGSAAAAAYLTDVPKPAALAYHDVIAGGIAVAVLLGTCALIRAVRQRRPTVPGHSAALQAEIERLRTALRRQQVRLRTIARTAEDELTALSDPRRTRPPAPDPVAPPEGTA
ncbi:MFS transporter [Nonomuraea sp. NPDC049504]|uniref:MFS transporter n=1 Tax=Nonomuraea sp. NPDC049504 TaxID=3154729 RepID=UPI003425C7D6